MKIKLKKLGKIITGNTPKKSDKQNYTFNDICFVKPSDISDDVITKITNTEHYISNYATNTARLAPKDSVLVTCIGIIGKVAILEKNSAFNQQINAIIPYKDKVLSNYLAYNLFYRKNYMQQKANAPVVPIINKTQFEDLEITFHSLEEQKKIANTLDKVTNLIELRKKQLEKLDIFSKALFVEMFGDPVENPMRWELDILSNQCQKIGSGLTPKGGKTSYVNSGVCLIRSMNVHNGFFKYKDLVHINNKQAELLKNVIVKENDVLLNITGASVARSCIVPPELLPARVNQHVSIIRLNMDKVLPIFFNNLIINSNFQKYLKHISDNNGATRQALTKQQLENLNIILPPIELQNQFAKKVEQIDKIKLSIQDSLNKLETLKKSLMQEYFS